MAGRIFESRREVSPDAVLQATYPAAVIAVELAEVERNLRAEMFRTGGPYLPVRTRIVVIAQAIEEEEKPA